VIRMKGAELRALIAITPWRKANDLSQNMNTGAAPIHHSHEH
jgi:hypothetical protein